MAGKSRTCKGCGAVQAAPSALSSGYCEQCNHDLQHLSYAEIKAQRPRLWGQLVAYWQREKATTGGTVAEIEELLAADERAEEARER